MLCFDNKNLNFSVPTAVVKDFGQQNCLDFTYSGTTISYIQANVFAPEHVGHGYVGKYQNGQIIKFIVDSFQQGIVYLNYALIPCTIVGDTVKIGGKANGSYNLGLGYDPFEGVNYNITINNSNSNFFIINSGAIIKSSVPVGFIDEGPKSCLDFGYSGTPIDTSITLVNGHGYAGVVGDGRILRFIAGPVNNDVLTICYIFNE